MPDHFYEILLGLGFAVMTGAVIIALIRPLAARKGAEGAHKPHLAFYRDQLTEIERDVSRSVLAESEAEAARNEIARRMLAAEEAATSPSMPNPALRRKILVALLLLMPLTTLALYLAEGSPELQDMPFGPRVEGTIDTLPIEALAYRVSQRLKENPEDLQGWEVIAPIYQDIGKFRDAARAWERSIALGGSTAHRLTGLAEARISLANGEISKTDLALLNEAAQLDPLEPRAQYYLGLQEARDGKSQMALQRWENLLKAAPPSAEWRKGFEVAIARLRAPEQAAQETDQMIAGMVAGLAARLKTQPDDLDGWIRLVKSYGVLRKQSEADAALSDARRIFASDQQALARLDQAEAELKAALANP